MARVRRLKQVSFMSRGKRVFFMAKRGAAAAYRKSKPYAVRGAKYAYQKAVRAKNPTRVYPSHTKSNSGSGRRSPIRLGFKVRTRQGIGTVVAIRNSRSMHGRIAVVKFPGRRGEFSRLVFRTKDVERI